MTVNDETKRPKIGVGLILIKNGTHVLLAQRIGKHGAGEYGGLGGHMEYGEKAEETLMREVREEAGPELKITKPRIISITNVTKYAPKHYVDIGMTANWISGEPILMEPEKFASWDWYPLNDLPEPLFEFIKIYINELGSKHPLIDL
ncbi:MAG: MutT/nudix family protein probable [Candidatus Saccharibacteria bacterium]|nr:MutT/nudix family protein probable [Candidatus Saccharibacteria bacterium]